jgi:uncharacterized protein YkwD
MSCAGVRRTMGQALVLGLATLLTACGGGGGSDAAADATSTPQTFVPIDPPGGLPASSAVCTAALRDDVLAHVNAYRAAGATCASGTTYPAGGTALAWDSRLEAAARAHSQAMIDTNEFAHVVTGEADLGARILAEGYNYASARENIAAGRVYGDVSQVVAAWMNSTKGHCDNIMKADLAHVAVACLPGHAGNTYENYWTMDLGRLLR